MNVSDFGKMLKIESSPIYHLTMYYRKHQEYEQAALSNGGVLPVPLKENSQISLQQKSTTSDR